jgi:PEP-CTERM motif
MKRLLPLLLVIALSCAAQATDVYNNLNSTSNGSDFIVSFGPLADSFSTGNAAFTLAGIGLKLEEVGTPGGSFTIQLLADNNIFPGNPIYTIATVSDSSLTNSLQDYFFNLGTPQVLAPDTRYWIELSSSNGSVAKWSWSVDQSGVGVSGEYFFNQNGVLTNDNGPYQMQLSDQPFGVPEPSTLAMLATGMVAALGGVRRRFGA